MMAKHNLSQLGAKSQYSRHIPGIFPAYSPDIFLSPPFLAAFPLKTASAISSINMKETQITARCGPTIIRRSLSRYCGKFRPSLAVASTKGIGCLRRKRTGASNSKRRVGDVCAGRRPVGETGRMVAWIFARRLADPPLPARAADRRSRPITLDRSHFDGCKVLPI